MTARKIVTTVTFLCALVALSVPAHAQARYQVIDLGLLPGAPGCSATALNDFSDVVGTCDSPASTTGFDQTAFLWRLGQMTALPKLPGGHYSWPYAITVQGVVLGGADTGDYQPHAYMVRGGLAINIDPSGGQNSYALAQDDTGVIFGRYAKGLSGNSSSWSPVTYTEDPSKPGRFRRANLPLILGGDTKTQGGWLDGGNRAGQAIGTEVSSLFGERALFFANDPSHTPTALEPLVGGTVTVGGKINDFGVAVGQSYGSFVSRGVVWSNDLAHTPSELAPLAGDNNTSAIDVNNLGQVIGFSYYQVDPTVSVTVLHPALWENGVAQDVSTLLDATGAGWTIRYLSAINNLGEIAGMGTVNGQTRAFLLRPIAQ